MEIQSSSAFSDSKPHYQILDGLRGVAALMIVVYHVFEGFATTPFDQHFNHGYMAVDFFFILSGFVIGYAYDDRWKKMTINGFFKRRLIRLHPMVVMGTLIGVITFCIQGCVKWNGAHVSVWGVLLAALLGILMLPAIPGTLPEVRGNGEMFPLNGPSWSLFFEYIGNILYALIIRRLSTRKLAILCGVAGCALTSFAVLNLSGYGHLGVGWTLNGNNFLGGFLRMLYSYTAGMLLSRIYRPGKVKGAFWLCSVALFALFLVPHLGAGGKLWMNGIYDSLCAIVLFPAIVYLGASGQIEGKVSGRICKFLGDISYPLYMVHYPVMYLFFAWVWKNHLTFAKAWPVALAAVILNILLAWLCLKLYDEPVRKWLTKRKDYE